MKSRKFTREDVAFILELKAEGITYKAIAYYVFDITSVALRGRMRTWGA